MKIDREKVINGLSDIREDYEIKRCEISVQIVENAIEQLKEQSEIVRCKDCMNYVPCKENIFNIQGICMRMNQPADNEYYCADGVKRE